MFFIRKPNPIAQALITSIKSNPDKWHEGEFTIHIGNKQQHLSRIQLWTCSGYEYFKIYKPYEMKLQRYWKKRLWKAVQEWRSSLIGASDFLELLKECESVAE